MPHGMPYIILYPTHEPKPATTSSGQGVTNRGNGSALHRRGLAAAEELCLEQLERLLASVLGARDIGFPEVVDRLHYLRRRRRGGGGWRRRAGGGAAAE